MIDFLAFDRDNPGSILNCLRAARENARAVRGTITSEMWETLNATWLESRGNAPKRFRRRPRGVLRMGQVPLAPGPRRHLGTMLRDEGYISCDRHLPRACRQHGAHAANPARCDADRPTASPTHDYLRGACCCARCRPSRSTAASTATCHAAARLELLLPTRCRARCCGRRTHVREPAGVANDAVRRDAAARRRAARHAALRPLESSAPAGRRLLQDVPRRASAT